MVMISLDRASNVEKIYDWIGVRHGGPEAGAIGDIIILD